MQQVDCKRASAALAVVAMLFAAALMSPGQAFALQSGSISDDPGDSGENSLAEKVVQTDGGDPLDPEKRSEEAPEKEGVSSGNGGLEQPGQNGAREEKSLQDAERANAQTGTGEGAESAVGNDADAAAEGPGKVLSAQTRVVRYESSAGASAGSEGPLSAQSNAERAPSAQLMARAHIQNIGWGQGWRTASATADATGTLFIGTSGQALRLEALQFQLKGIGGSVNCQVHVQNIGWQDWVSGDIVAGTTGRSLRIEALQVQLIRRPSVPEPTRTVADGMYVMSMRSSGGYAAGTAGASDGNGANVQLVPNANWRLEEKWLITWKGNGYELTNVNSGKVLDAADGTRNMVANVRQLNRSNSKSQRWAIVPAAGGGYTLAGMSFGTVVTVQDGKMANATNLLLWSPDGGNSQRFNVSATEPVYAGTYQLFTKLDQSGKCATVPGAGMGVAKAVVNAANDGVDQHWILARSGSGFTVQSVFSGKYLTASGNDVVQASKNNAGSQVWNATYSTGGGLVFRNAATGRLLSVQGNRNANGAGLQNLGGNGSVAGQRWYPVGRSLVSDGLYELRTAGASAIVLDVAGGSYASGANDMVSKRNGGNNQKFAIAAVKDGYYRIGMPLGATVVTVQGSSKGNGANVRMESWNEAAAQLWKPVVTDGGLVFVNKNSGQALSFASTASGANVCQTANPGSSALQKWAVVRTSFNPDDLLTYRMLVQNAAGGGSAQLSNPVAGYSISKARWNQLVAALNRIWSQGADVGFVMVDENTGMAVSLNADKTFYGASTVKALWVTYLFQEYLEKGRISWGQVGWYVETAIADSNNESYLYLRSHYGSEAGFDQWLAESGVGHIGTWDWYSPRTLAKAWTHMLVYSKSNGRYVGTWKNVFSHSYYSAIREGIGSYRTTYSKPGWLPAGYRIGNTLDDAAIVDDRNGRRYLVSIMSSVQPYGDHGPLKDLARALDAIHMEMPRSR